MSMRYQKVVLIVPAERDDGDPATWEYTLILRTVEEVQVVSSSRVCDTLDAAYEAPADIEVQ